MKLNALQKKQNNLELRKKQLMLKQRDSGSKKKPLNKLRDLELNKRQLKQKLRD